MLRLDHANSTLQAEEFSQLSACATPGEGACAATYHYLSLNGYVGRYPSRRHRKRIQSFFLVPTVLGENSGPPELHQSSSRIPLHRNSVRPMVPVLHPIHVAPSCRRGLYKKHGLMAPGVAVHGEYRSTRILHRLARFDLTVPVLHVSIQHPLTAKCYIRSYGPYGLEQSRVRLQASVRRLIDLLELHQSTTPLNRVFARDPLSLFSKERTASFFQASLSTKGSATRWLTS